MSKRAARKRSSGGAKAMGSPFVGIFGLDSTGLIGAPLDVVKQSFRDTLSWLRKEPPDDFTPEELAGVINAGQDVAKGQLDSAIDKLREVLSQQESRRKHGTVRKTLALVRKRKQPTLVCTLLAALLNHHAVTRGDQALKKFNQKISEDIISRLKAMPRQPIAFYNNCEPLREGYYTLYPELLCLPTNRHDVLAKSFQQRYGYESIGDCAVCGKPAVAELRHGEGKTSKLCPWCAKNAQSILTEHENHKQGLKRTFEECYTELTEAAALNPKDKVIKENCRVLDELLCQLPRNEAPNSMSRTRSEKKGRLLAKYMVKFLLILAVVGIVSVAFKWEPIFLGCILIVIVILWPLIVDVLNYRR
jgi:hypothetical protein